MKCQRLGANRNSPKFDVTVPLDSSVAFVKSEPAPDPRWNTILKFEILSDFIIRRFVIKPCYGKSRRPGHAPADLAMAVFATEFATNNLRCPGLSYVPRADLDSLN